MENPWELVPCPDFGTNSFHHQVPPLLNGTENNNNNTFSLGYSHSGWDPSNSSGFGFSGLNFTFPCWDPADILRKDTFKKIVNDLNIYFTPIIIIIGATGNLMAFLVFTVTHLRRQSSSVFLASLAIADLGYLVALLFIWLSWIKIPIFHRQVWCQMVLYMEAVFTFLSVW